MSITIQEAKAKGTRVVERLKGLGYPLTHAQALEVVATVYGDINWHAMKVRLSAEKRQPLTAPARAPLSIFEVTVAFENEYEDAEPLETRYVVCESEDQAKQVVFDLAWDARLDCTDCTPAYDVTRTPFVEAPALEYLLEWLLDSQRIGAVWQAFQKMGVVPSGDTLRDVPERMLGTVVENALMKASSTVETVSDLFRAIYKELGQNDVFMADEGWIFQCGDENLVFKAD